MVHPTGCCETAVQVRDPTGFCMPHVDCTDRYLSPFRITWRTLSTQIPKVRPRAWLRVRARASVARLSQASTRPRRKISGSAVRSLTEWAAPHQDHVLCYKPPSPSRPPRRPAPPAGPTPLCGTAPPPCGKRKVVRGKNWNGVIVRATWMRQ